MKHPPYQLRSNKAVDRLLFAELLRWWDVPKSLKKYKYIGFGGPYLDDFKIIHELFPSMKMISVEEDEQTYKRQKVHLPCRHITLENIKFSAFVTNYDPQDSPSIFWIDHTGLKPGHFLSFSALLAKLVAGSIVKITLGCHVSDFTDKPNEQEKDAKLKLFTQQYQKWLPPDFIAIPIAQQEFAFLLQKMIRIAAEKSLAGTGHMFQLLNSFCYEDGTGMFTLCGMVCESSKEKEICKKFAGLKFVNLEWRIPTKIDVPVLSTIERLRFQKHLPKKNSAGQQLHKLMGYEIGRGEVHSVNQLQQYADFSRYYPHFIKAIP